MSLTHTNLGYNIPLKLLSHQPRPGTGCKTTVMNSRDTSRNIQAFFFFKMCILKKATCEPSLNYDFKSENVIPGLYLYALLAGEPHKQPCAARWSLGAARTSLRSLSLTGTAHF